MELVHQLPLDVFAAGAVGISHCLRLQESAAQAIDGADVRLRRAVPHGAGDRRLRQHHLAAGDQAAFLHQLVKRVADHDDDVDLLAARQARRDRIAGGAHRRSPCGQQPVAAGALVGGRQILVGLGEAARADHVDVGGVRRAGGKQEQRRKKGVGLSRQSRVKHDGDSYRSFFGRAVRRQAGAMTVAGAQ